MELKDIGTKELKELNLYPISYFKQFQQIVENGYFIIPNNNYRYEKNVPSLRDIAYSSKYNKDGEKIKIKNFLELSKEEIEMIGFGGKSLFKLLWLQKYLRGEVSGCYSVTEDMSFQSFQELVELDKKDKIIHRLNIQLEEEREKNKELKTRINELENEIKKASKLKIKLLKFIKDNQKLLEEYSSELI